MPTYDYECPSGCRPFTAVLRIADRLKATCPKCGTLGRQILPPPEAVPVVSTFHGGWFRDIGPEPIYCETPQELRDACDLHNCYSHQLADGIFKTSPGPDPTPETAPEAFSGGGSQDSPDNP